MSFCRPATAVLARLCDLSRPVAEEDLARLVRPACMARLRQEELAGLVYHRLRQGGLLHRLPPAVAASLEAAFYTAAAVAAHRQVFLGEILALGRRRGIPLVVLKGALLAQWAYEHPAARPMDDVDLLVRRRDWPAAHRLLTELGYRPPVGAPAAPGDTYLTAVLYRAGGGPPIHLHCHPVNSAVPNLRLAAAFQPEVLWRQAVAVTVADEPCLMLAPHHQLLHLAEHSLRVSHSLARIRYLCDLDRFLRWQADNIDWQEVLAAAGRLPLAAFLRLPLARSVALLHSPVPPAVLDLLALGPANRLERVFASLAHRDLVLPGTAYLLHLAAEPGLLARLRFLGRTLAPPARVLGQRAGCRDGRPGLRPYLDRMAAVAVTAGWNLWQVGRRLAAMATGGHR